MVRRSVAVAVLAVAVMAVTTQHRVTVWRNDLTLWTDAASKAPGKARPRLNVGRQHELAGDLAAAERDYRAVVSMSYATNYPKFRQEEARAAAETNLAHLLMKQGQLASAMRMLDTILRQWPNYPYAHYNRGIVLRHIRECPAANAEFYIAQRFDPTLKLPTPLCPTEGGNE